MNNSIKSNFNALTILIFVIVGVVVLFVIYRKLKHLKLPNVVMISGAPKTGKSALCLYLARKRYIGNVIKWKLGKPIYWLCKHTMLGYPLKPMFYSNIPVKFKHNPITGDILTMDVKVPKKSVFFFDEASLLADSMLFKDEKLNYDLLLWFKTIGHTTYGGSVFLNSQCIADVHHAIKRVLGSYLYIQNLNTALPFVGICNVREMIYSDDGNVGNMVTEDMDLSMRKVIILKRVFKWYDCFALSTLTDKKPYKVDYDYQFDKKNLKVYYVVSFNPRTDRVNEKLKHLYFDEAGHLLSEEERFNMEVKK